MHVRCWRRKRESVCVDGDVLRLLVCDARALASCRRRSPFVKETENLGACVCAWVCVCVEVSVVSVRETRQRKSCEGCVKCGVRGWWLKSSFFRSFVTFVEWRRRKKKIACGLALLKKKRRMTEKKKGFGWVIHVQYDEGGCLVAQ